MEVNLLNGSSLFIFYSYDDNDIRPFFSNFSLIDREDLYKIRRFIALKDYVKNNRHIKIYYSKNKFYGEIICNNKVELKISSINIFDLFFLLNDYSCYKIIERRENNLYSRKRKAKVV